jgi:bis(5'-nucleosyl)-tetraphosphatase (symmetrical)
MSTYAIGDIQGCYDAFVRLVEVIRFDPARDRLWLAGDLVNRGKQSLEVLRFAVAHRTSVLAVLGNHDLHLITRARGGARPKSLDTLDGVLSAPDRDELIGWLASQPLVHREGDAAIVHAGVLPDWSWDEIEERADRACAAIRTGAWDPNDETIAVLTRLRLVDRKGRPKFGFAGRPEEAPEGQIPWFDAPRRRTKPLVIMFGHWAALGHVMREDVIALDSGCVWGGKLTAVRVEDRAVFQVPHAARSSNAG